MYYSYDQTLFSRFAHSYVAAEYGPSIRNMTAAHAGAGFIFDTNGIHRAAPELAARHRDAILFEFNAAAKSAELRMHVKVPCPMAGLVNVSR